MRVSGKRSLIKFFALLVFFSGAARTRSVRRTTHRISPVSEANVEDLSSPTFTPNRPQAPPTPPRRGRRKDDWRMTTVDASSEGGRGKFVSELVGVVRGGKGRR